MSGILFLLVLYLRNFPIWVLSITFIFFLRLFKIWFFFKNNLHVIPLVLAYLCKLQNPPLFISHTLLQLCYFMDWSIFFSSFINTLSLAHDTFLIFLSQVTHFKFIRRCDSCCSLLCDNSLTLESGMNILLFVQSLCLYIPLLQL